MTRVLLAVALALLVRDIVRNVRPAVAAPGQVVRIEHYDPSTTPARGPAHALVTVELFFAPTVNGSRLALFRLLEQLQQQHPTRMRIVYRVVQRNAQPPGPQLPTLALEAYAEGKFFEFVSAIQALRPGALTRDQMLDLGKKLGLDPARMDRAIRDDRYRDVIVANERRLDRLRGPTAPSVFFNDKLLPSSNGQINEKDLADAYDDAYKRALDVLDRGVDRQGLEAAFDAEMLSSTQPVVFSAPADNPADAEGDGTQHRLATPPLDLRGLPSLGKPGLGVQATVAILCRPNDAGCAQQLRIGRTIQNTYRGDVRVVWAPWFDVSRDDAADLGLLGDAALCAESVGSSPEDLDTSPGWEWVTELYGQIGRSRGRRLPADKLIDSVAAKLHIDAGSLSACRARVANTTLDWIAAARHAGVTRSPAIVIGGRIYEDLQDQLIIQQLVEAELAPGVLGGMLLQR